MTMGLEDYIESEKKRIKEEEKEERENVNQDVWKQKADDAADKYVKNIINGIKQKITLAIKDRKKSVNYLAVVAMPNSRTKKDLEYQAKHPEFRGTARYFGNSEIILKGFFSNTRLIPDAKILLDYPLTFNYFCKKTEEKLRQNGLNIVKSKSSKGYSEDYMVFYIEVNL